jgi:uncharacterized protein YndB with AHSA1/START domain
MPSEGSLVPAGDRWQLRFERRLAHPPEKVWPALTEPGHLTVWFPADIEGERAAGAKVRFVFRNGEGPPSDGEILVYAPASTLELRWEDEILRFDLRPEGEGCVLTFVDTFAELGKASRDGAGWHVCLDLLEHHLAGQEPPRSNGAHWRDVHDIYVERFGPEASTIGPPAGMDLS